MTLPAPAVSAAVRSGARPRTGQYRGSLRPGERSWP